MKKTLIIIPFLLLIIITIISLIPEKAGTPSSYLDPITTETEDTIRIDYVNEDRQITYASDKKYATVIKTKENGNIVLEEYFDENGKPTASYNNAVAISTSYNDEGQAEWIHYLDDTGNPVVITSGYDTLHRTYNKDGLADTETYYTAGKPVSHNDGFYGYKKATYDDKERPVELQYLDQNGKLTLHKNGYAIIKREYWDDTSFVKRELYYDEDARPVADNDGKFGYYRECDEEGRETLTTYLDANNKPINNKSGYATIKTEYENDSVKKLYFDKDGKPTTLGKNQYGTETVNGQIIYLNKDGSRMLRIDNFMHNHPLHVMIIGIILTLLSICLKKHGHLILLFISIAIIIIMTLLFRETGAIHSPNISLSAFEIMFKNKSTMHEVINNIWLFVPLGAVVYKQGSRNWIIPIIITFAIELLQLVTGKGAFELADIICNSLGGMIGYVLSHWCQAPER